MSIHRVWRLYKLTMDNWEHCIRQRERERKEEPFRPSLEGVPVDDWPESPFGKSDDTPPPPDPSPYDMGFW